MVRCRLLHIHWISSNSGWFCVTKDSQIKTVYTMNTEVYSQYIFSILGCRCPLRRRPRTNRCDMRVLLDILLWHGTLGRYKDHEKAKTWICRAKSTGRNCCHVLRAVERRFWLSGQFGIQGKRVPETEKAATATEWQLDLYLHCITAWTSQQDQK